MAKAEQLRSPQAIADQLNCQKAAVTHWFDFAVAPSNTAPSTLDSCVSDDAVSFALYANDLYVWNGNTWVQVTS